MMSDRGREAQAAMGYPALVANRLEAGGAQASEALDSEGRNINAVRMTFPMYDTDILIENLDSLAGTVDGRQAVDKETRTR